MGWETEVDAINLELETRLKEITRLENRVIRAVPQKTSEWPTVWLQLERVEEDINSEMTQISFPRISHELVYNMLFQDRWDSDESPEVNEDEKIERWGEIRDKLMAYTNNYPKWERMWIPSMDYAQLRREARYTLLDIEAEVRVVKTW